LAAKILKARQEGNEFKVVIHLDTSRVIQPTQEERQEDGSVLLVPDGDPVPDPAWVHESSWAVVLPGDPDPARQAAREASALREAKLLAAEALTRLQKASPVAAPVSQDEGAEFTL
jgi:hypothetical protein